jgi:hypothetical protein
MTQASATTKKPTNPNSACVERLREIEHQYGKIAGQNLRGSELHPSELADFIRLGA